MNLEDSNLHYPPPRPNGPQGFLRSLGSFLNLLNLVTGKGMSALRPAALQLVPIFVCLFLIPFAVFLSIFAGWMVWKSLSVGWEVPLYLQYGWDACLMTSCRYCGLLTLVANALFRTHLLPFPQYRHFNLTTFPSICASQSLTPTYPLGILWPLLRSWPLQIKRLQQRVVLWVYTPSCSYLFSIVIGSCTSTETIMAVWFAQRYWPRYDDS